MFRNARMICFMGICMSTVFVGCATDNTLTMSPTTVSKTFVLDNIAQQSKLTQHPVSSITFAGPKVGSRVFTYADVTQPMYISGMMIPGGKKRADVTYSLENDATAILSKAMTQVFTLDGSAPSSVSGVLTFDFSDVTSAQRKSSTTNTDVEVLMTLDLEVTKGSSTILRRSYSAKKSDSSSGLMITFPSNSFLNTLFAGAMSQVLIAVSSDSELSSATAR